MSKLREIPTAEKIALRHKHRLSQKGSKNYCYPAAKFMIVKKSNQLCMFMHRLNKQNCTIDEQKRMGAVDYAVVLVRNATRKWHEQIVRRDSIKIPS